MSIENGWDGVRGERSRLEMASMGALRVALLFGSAAIALALIRKRHAAPLVRRMR